MRAFLRTAALKNSSHYEHGFTPALLFLSLGREEKNIVDPNEQ